MCELYVEISTQEKVSASERPRCRNSQVDRTCSEAASGAAQDGAEAVQVRHELRSAIGRGMWRMATRNCAPADF